MSEQVQYIDIFAETGPEIIDDYELRHAEVLELYEAEKIEFDNAADRFIQRSEELELSAHYQGLLDKAALVNEAVHRLCGHDQGLDQARQRSALYADTAHDANEGHAHEHASHENEDDKKKKKKKTAESLWDIILKNMGK